MKDTYTFKREYDFTMSKGSVTNEISAAIWQSLADEFLCFLKGCGYQVERADLCDYYMDPEPVEDDL